MGGRKWKKGTWLEGSAGGEKRVANRALFWGSKSQLPKKMLSEKKSRTRGGTLYVPLWANI